MIDKKHVSWLLLLLVGIVTPVAAEDVPAPSKLAQFFGFRPLEIFKLETRSANLLAGDVDRDGLVDLVLVDNSHSRIDVLRQRKARPATEKAAAPDDDDVNQVKNDWRFEHRKIAVDKQIAAMVLGDFNGDGRNDLAYLGMPDRLIVRFQSPRGEWTKRLEYRVPDVTPSRGSLVTGDLDNNGRADLVLLGKNETSVFYQSATGKLAPAKTLMNTSSKLGLARVSDINGDGRADLCYSTLEGQQRSFCARFQDEQGRLGPELRFELPPHRDIHLGNMDAQRGRELLVVETQTNRVKLMRFQAAGKVEAAQPKQRLIQYGFGRQGADRTEQLRDVATGDVDGDGRIDVVVSDPVAAQTIVFRQRAKGGLDLGQAYPGLQDTRHLRIGNVDGRPGNEVVVVSVREKTLGVCRMQDGRLSFPEAVSTRGAPLACELVDVDHNGQPEIVYVAKARKGGGHLVAMLQPGPEGKLVPRMMGKQEQVDLKLKGEPRYLLSLDANRDGHPDLLVFQDLEQAPVLLAGTKDGSLQPVTTKGGIQLGDVGPGRLFTGDLAAPSILVAQEKFARNLKLTAEGSWQVLDQYNATESNAKIVGVAALELDAAPGKEIVLVDSGVRRLKLMRRQGEGKLFQPWREVELGTLNYRASRIADLDGDKRDDLLLVGNGKFAVLYNGRQGPQLEEVSAYESRRKRALFGATVSGDLNGDGRVDVAVVDRRSHRISLLDYSGSHGLRHAVDFLVFEEKSFRGASGAATEPREVIVADVTGDDRLDLILLAHDRVIVYPQDDGVKDAPGR